MAVIKSLLVILFISLLTCCSSSHLDDFREEGKGYIRALISELQQIRTRDDLNPHASRLEFLFNELATVMIEAQSYKKSHPGSGVREDIDTTDADQLRIELNRVLRLEGGREVLEKAQETALNRLDSFIKAE